MYFVKIFFKKKGNHDPAVFEFKLEHGKELIIGREQGDLLLPDTKVSRIHCALSAEFGTLSLIDKESSNGTYVNFEKLEPNKKKNIQVLDVIHVGGYHMEIREFQPYADYIKMGSSNPPTSRISSTGVHNFNSTGKNTRLVVGFSFLFVFITAFSVYRFRLAQASTFWERLKGDLTRVYETKFKSKEAGPEVATVDNILGTYQEGFTYFFKFERKFKGVLYTGSMSLKIKEVDYNKNLATVTVNGELNGRKEDSVLKVSLNDSRLDEEYFTSNFSIETFAKRLLYVQNSLKFWKEHQSSFQEGREFSSVKFLNKEASKLEMKFFQEVNRHAFQGRAITSENPNYVVYEAIVSQLIPFPLKVISWATGSSEDLEVITMVPFKK